MHARHNHTLQIALVQFHPGHSGHVILPLPTPMVVELGTSMNNSLGAKMCQDTFLTRTNEGNVGGVSCASEQSRLEAWEGADSEAALEAMEWAIPQFKRAEVDWAGRRLAVLMRKQAGWASQDFTDWHRSLDIINNWRSAHAYPLNILQDSLRKKARRGDLNAVVAQRTKRLWSIWHKLDRFKTMQLSQMQDIGGCRAILSTSEQVHALLDDYKASSVRHKARRITDYIAEPRASGYRGIHIIWEYRGTKETYNGLKIEMQIRSALQHAWATSVETMGTLTRQALKSSIGEGDWLRFFALMGTAIALREGTPAVPNTPIDHMELVDELRDYAGRVNAVTRLRTIGDALQQLEQPSAREAKAHFFLLELDADRLKVTGFRQNQQAEAQSQYVQAEKLIADDDNRDAVLVSVDSLSSLRRAYPNYFLDTRVFADLLDSALDGQLLDPDCLGA